MATQRVVPPHMRPTLLDCMPSPGGEVSRMMACHPADLPSGYQGDGTVPQLPRCPALCREPGRGGDASEPAPDVVRVELGASLGTEHETAILPASAGQPARLGLSFLLIT